MAFFQTQHLWISHLADGVAAIVLDRHDSPTNYLDPGMLDDLSRAIDTLREGGQYRLLVIRSGKMANYCHGVPSTLLTNWSEEDFADWAVKGQKLCAMLSEMPILSVAVIAGSCFDAGLELALACDYRVVVDRPSTLLGFPELEWGMIPCWGGTQRLPHLIGLENSMHTLLTGDRYNARQAVRCGLADDLADEATDDPPRLLAHSQKREWSSFPRRTWREKVLESNRFGRWFLFRGAERVIRTRLASETPAPAEMLAALRKAYQGRGIDLGVAFERQALQRIVQHPALHHLLRLLAQREKLRPSVDELSREAPIRFVGINGAGVLGLSLLLHGVNKGYEMVLRTEDDAALGTALTQIVLLLQSEVRHGNMTEAQYQKSLNSIRGTYTWTHFDKLDLIIDTVRGESLAEKLAFYRELEKQVPTNALLVSGSLTRRVEELLPALQRPDRLLGLHIIEPWKSGSLAEIVVPESASSAATVRVRDWTVSLGKCGLQIPDRLGGLAMRIWLPALNEAGLLIHEGFTIDGIDAAMRHFGMAHGPLEWMDRIGVDNVLAMMTACQPLFAERFSFAVGFSGMVDKQWLGNRAKVGFYRHGGRLKPNRAAAVLWKTTAPGEIAQPGPALSKADTRIWIQQRLVTLMVLEAVRCLEEGLVKSADELDCAMCLTGWASHRGGPIGYARQLGYENLVETCDVFTQLQGVRFAPFAYVEKVLAHATEG